jgi:hypothetical protein
MMPWTSRDVAFVCGVGLNARTIVDELSRVGWPGQVFIVTTVGSSLGHVARVVRRCGFGVHRFDASDADGVPAGLASRVKDGARGVVFFTDERLLPAFVRWRNECPVGPLVFHCGASHWLGSILDRLAFYDALRGLEGINVPSTVPGESDPFEVFGDAFVLRPRVSWQADGTRQTVRVVRGRAAFDKELARLGAIGLQRGDVCFQELLSTDALHNVSVSGWFDGSSPALMASRKVKQHPMESGDGDLVEAIPLSDLLERQTRSVLSALEYVGPFELEFVLDRHDGAPRVIELNPRYWLQHGLAEKRLEHGVTSRYIQLQASVPPRSESVLPSHWIDSGYALIRALRGDVSGLHLLRKGRAWSPVGLSEAIMMLPQRFSRRMGSR